jgi:1-acyl-sn-glycerol-3-phosphate acyltransferase
MEFSHFLSFRRAFALLSIFFYIIMVQGPAHLLGCRTCYRWGHRWHKWCRFAAGMTVRCHGAPSRSHPTLFVSNHVSYLDIPAIGSVLDATFIAKADIKKWPLFGTLCKLQRTLFIERDRRKIREQRTEIFDRLAAGDNLILFPEGTSNDGTFVRPFKSALFSAAEYNAGEKPLAIQPVSIAYTQLDGIVLGRRLRPIFAWYGDMDMISHFWKLLGAGKLGVELVFHEPVTLADFESRKALSDYCERQVRHGLSSALSGRLSRQPHPALSAPAPAADAVAAE